MANCVSFCKHHRLSDQHRLPLAFGSENTPDEQGWTPLMYTAQFSEDLEVIKALITSCAEPNVKGLCDTIPFHFAGENDDPRVVQAFIDAGVDINAQDCDGKTCLMIAAEKTGILRS